MRGCADPIQSTVTDGVRVETYVFAGERGSGVLGVDGAAAHLVHEGGDPGRPVALPA